jgi:hypothetical protein
MSQLAYKYLQNGIRLEYSSSLFAMKAILHESEISDSRPTVIKIASQKPFFASVLSGKFNTIYDLDEII